MAGLAFSKNLQPNTEMPEGIDAPKAEVNLLPRTRHFSNPSVSAEVGVDQLTNGDRKLRRLVTAGIIMIPVCAGLAGYGWWLAQQSPIK